MKPTSLDLRERIMEALAEEPSSLKVGKRFKISASSVRKLRLKVQRTGVVAAGTAPGKERLVRGKTEQRLRKLVGQHPDATLAVLCELLEDVTGVGVSATTMCRQLRRMGLTLKKSPSTRRRETVPT